MQTDQTNRVNQIKKVRGPKNSMGEDVDYVSANLVTRAELMAAIVEIVKDKGWTQGQTAEFLGVGQPRISDVYQGRVDRFSVDMLMVWLQKLGKDVSVTVRNNIFSSEEKVRLALYVCGVPDEKLLTNVSRLFAGDSEKYSLRIIDVLVDSQLAHNANITATPTLVKEYPEPIIVLTGDMSAQSVRWQLATAELKRVERLNAQQNSMQISLDAQKERQDMREIEQNERSSKQSQRDAALDLRDAAQRKDKK